MHKFYVRLVCVCENNNNNKKGHEIFQASLIDCLFMHGCDNIGVGYSCNHGLSEGDNRVGR